MTSQGSQDERQDLNPSQEGQEEPAEQIEASNICGICQNGIESDAALTRLDCNPEHHIFHSNCLECWYNERAEDITRLCPYPFCDGRNASDEEWDSTSQDSEPPYTRHELVEMIKGHYELLVRMYIPSKALKYPPEGGWPNITPEATALFGKSPLVVDLLRHLPYIETDGYSNFHNIDYKTNVVDYSTTTAEEFASSRRLRMGENLSEDLEDWEEHKQHSIVLAQGYESGGKHILLNTLTGDLTIHVIRFDSHDEDIEWYVRKLADDFENLQSVPIPGFDMCEHSSGEDNIVGSDDVLVEPPVNDNADWPSDADVAWIRHLYRSHGWPGPDYRKEEALEAVRTFAQKRSGFEQLH